MLRVLALRPTDARATRLARASLHGLLPAHDLVVELVTGEAGVTIMTQLPGVLGDSLAAGLTKQLNRDIERSILRKLERSFSPTSRRIGAVKRARLDWLRNAGAVLVYANETKRKMLSIWLFPDSDGSWIEISDLISAGQSPVLANARIAITQHAAQRLLQARVSITAAAQVRRHAHYLQPENFYTREAARTFEPSGEFASTHGLWRFDSGVLVTFIALEVLDPLVLARHQRGIEAGGWIAP